MVYGKVFVAGGAKGVGRAVIDKLVEQGSEVVALVRREDAKAELDAINGKSTRRSIRLLLCALQKWTTLTSEQQGTC